MVRGYCRISTSVQLHGNSLEEQEHRIKSQYLDAEIYKEVFTGASSIGDRPVFRSILDKSVDGDIIVTTKLDRFCRNTEEGLKDIRKLLDRGVKVYILNMGLIEDTPIGKLILTQLLAFAEFERAMIMERMSSGKAIAKANNPNFKEGRPVKYNKEQRRHAVELLNNHSYREVSDMTGISTSMLKQYKRDNKIINN